MELWERWLQDDKTGLYLPVDDFEMIQRRFLESPQKSFNTLRQAYAERYGESALAELVGFLEEHVLEIPSPWRHLALADLYNHSHRLAEAEYELEQALKLPEGRVWEVYELYIQVLLCRKRWKRALEAASSCEEILKKELQALQRAKIYYYRACAAALAGDVEGGLGNLEAAEAYGFEKVKLEVLRLELLAGRYKQLEKRLRELERRIWRALIEILITQLSQLSQGVICKVNNHKQ
ncbi:MAG: hypothetical protein QXU09_05315 [Thermoproteota archaeon]